LAVIVPSPEPLVDGVWRGPEALRYARTCYGHLAGKAGVALLDALLWRGYLADNGSDYAVTAEGEAWLDELGVHRPKLKRPLTRRCLDWSERQPHLAGSLGVALTTRLIELKWLARKRDSRAVRLTQLGRQALEWQLGLHLDA
jgi:hypothetical protein